MIEESLNETNRNASSFEMRVVTAAGNNYGTDDNVYFKLFDDTGHASVTRRAQIPFIDNYEQGSTTIIPSFMTVFGDLSRKITKVLIIKSKKKQDAWVPQYIKIGEIINERHFLVSEYLTSGGDLSVPSLHKHYNWVSVPERDLTKKKGKLLKNKKKA